MSQPIIPLNSLPKQLGTISDNSCFVIVDDNNRTVRITWKNIASGLVGYTTKPTSPASLGTQHSISNDVAGLYSYAEGKWGKSPRYTSNWDDISETTRFLLVNATMSLTDTEKTNALTTLGIAKATGTTVGLVKGSSSVQVATDGSLEVADASNTTKGIVVTTEGNTPVARTQYVDEQIAAIPAPTLPIASSGTLGGIIPSDTVQVNSITGQATVAICVPGSGLNGLVKLAPLDSYTSAHASQAAPVALVEKIATEKAKAVSTIATESVAGAVLPSGSITLNTTTGAIDVKQATGTVYGTVRKQSAITESTTKTDVPTVQAIIDYVQLGSQGVISSDRLPLATAATPGAVRSSATVKVTTAGPNAGQAYVPAATATTNGVVMITTKQGDTAPTNVPTTFYVTEAIKEATSGIQTAAVNEAKALRPTSTAYGMVKVVPSATDTGATIATVPTEQHMKDYVGNAVSGLSWNGGTVTNAAVFSGGLSTPDVVDPTATSVLNYGQLQTLISGGSGTIPEATATTLGGIKVDIKDGSTLVKDSSGCLNARLAGELTNSLQYPGIVMISVPTGSRKPSAGDPDYYMTYSMSAIDYKIADTLVAVDSKITAFSNATGNIAGVKTFTNGLKTPNKTAPASTDVLNYGQLQTLISGGGTGLDSVIPKDGNTYAIKYTNGIYRSVRIGEVPIIKKDIGDDMTYMYNLIPPGNYRLDVADYGFIPTSGEYIVLATIPAGTTFGSSQAAYTLTDITVPGMTLSTGIIRVNSEITRMLNGSIMFTVNTSMTFRDLVWSLISDGNNMPQTIKLFEA